MVVVMWKMWTTSDSPHSSGLFWEWTTCEQLSTSLRVTANNGNASAYRPRVIKVIFRTLSTNGQSFPHNIASYPQGSR
jgi:hypothetical protein